MTTRSKIFKGEYKGHKMWSNGYCIYVTLNNRTRYFGCGVLAQQISRTMQEIDNFTAGIIE